MAKKKKMGWDFDDKTAAKEAESTIKKTSKIKEPKTKRGPAKREEKLARLLVKDDDRKKLKTLASMMDETMIDAFEIIIREAWNKRMK